ncbi:MAG: hypothetical protein J6N55_02880 [Anaerovibrio sp.]|uniref:hypothetical protein n=1 Tax=Anaerovibrio sp. TaxID=1872532 RepID=UPI001B102007|nr:hypothetical protein [Anaerovibrio sp.]MBO6245210.1 hypothetical protein [Anaerovibrio sp.]
MILILLLIAYAAYANQLPTSEMSLNGISPGASMDYIKGIYGEPQLLRSNSGEKTYSYGGTLFLRTIQYGNSHESVTFVESTANNGFSTPAGVTVGIKVSELFDLYGPEELQVNSNSETFYHYTRRESGSGITMLIFVTGNRISAIRIF